MQLPAQPQTQREKENAARSSEPAPAYRVYFFGPFRIIRGDQPIGEPVWRRNKAKALLKWFLLNTGRMVSADQLTEIFWPEATRSSAPRNLHVTINYLRHLIEPDLRPRQQSGCIRRNKNNFYWFEVDDSWWVDIFEVDRHYAAAREAEQRGDTAAIIMHYRTIVDYCNLEFLPEDTYEDTFSSYRRHYERVHTEALNSLIQLCSQTGMFHEALEYAHQALLIDPYNETAVKAIISAYFQQGNTAGAIHRLDTCHQFLKEDLGIEPGDDILSLRKKMARMG